MMCSILRPHRSDHLGTNRGFFASSGETAADEEGLTSTSTPEEEPDECVTVSTHPRLAPTLMIATFPPRSTRSYPIEEPAFLVSICDINQPLSGLLISFVQPRFAI